MCCSLSSRVSCRMAVLDDRDRLVAIMDDGRFFYWFVGECNEVRLLTDLNCCLRTFFR